MLKSGVLLLLLFGGTLALQSGQAQRQKEQAQAISKEQQAEALAHTQTQLNLWKKSPTFGFSNLIADWAFLQFLQYFGDDEARTDTGYGLSPDYFEVIIPRDPFYTPFYLFLSGSSSLFAGQPERTVALMDAGLSRMTPTVPADGYLAWRYKGTDELLFLGDANAAQVSFQMAADWASQANDPMAQAVAAASQRTADFLANNPVSKRAQVDAWAGILSNSFDQRTQRLAIDRIQGLGGQVTIADDGQVTIQYPQED